MTGKSDWANGRLFSAAVFGFCLLLLVVVLSPASAQETLPAGLLDKLQSMPTSQTFHFQSPDYELVAEEKGLTKISVDGFYSASLPGDPDVPATLFFIALPPLVSLDSVRLEIDAVEKVDLPGRYQIEPVGPFMQADDVGPYGADWGPNAPTIVDGKNTAVYERNTFYPENPVELAGVANMRKWRIATLRYWPISYNPVSGQLRLATNITVTLRYDPPSLASGSMDELQDRLMDDRAAATLWNYAEALPWYESMITDPSRTAEALPGYAIITTNEIVAASSILDDFVAHKASLGYAVQVVTEDQYGSLTGEPPNGRADKIRQWLGEHWKSDDLLYVLLIGDPNPLDNSAEPEDPDIVGDLPMKMIDGVPTDFYFADLYSTDPINWDWSAEVYVGRIPVYKSDGNWAAILDGILQKTINYENAGDVSWRRSALLPMAFLSEYSDTAPLAESMKDEYLESAGFSTHTLYWHGALSSSWYRGDEELVDGAVRARWQRQPFGIVAWYGHGNPKASSIYDEYDGGSGLGDILNSSEVLYLDDTRPALTFQASCSTGTPEVSNNLGYALLRQGAVGTVSASRETWSGSWPGPGTSNGSLMINYVKLIAENKTTGKSLYWSKSNPEGPEGGHDETNALAYNLYGDPSIHLLGPDSANVVVEPLTSPDEMVDRPSMLSASGPDINESTGVANVSEVSPGESEAAQQSEGSRSITSPTMHQLLRFPGNEPDQLVSMGLAHNCAITPAGDIDCQGIDSPLIDTWGQAVDQTGPYTQVSSGLYHTCGLKPDGSVHCWGRGSFGLDLDHVEVYGEPFYQISTGYLHTCGLTRKGRIECWGDNSAGQAAASWESYVQVSAGMQHTCGLTSSGSVNCWGRNSFGQANYRLGPFVQIDAGYFHTCGLKPDGSVDCWGSNHHGQATDQAGPYIQISTGWFHTCGLRPDGSVHCWGKNDYGQATDQPGPYIRISTSFYNSVGLRADGTLGFWGGVMNGAEQPGPYGQYRTGLSRMEYSLQEYGDGSHYTAVHLADMNGDQRLEVLVGNRDTTSLEIWRYDDGPDSLVKIDTMKVPYDIHDIKVADFDNDNDVDLVIGLRSMGLYYITNTGAPRTVGSWSPEHLNGEYTWQVLVEDFDKDGNLDIFDGLDYGPILMFYGDGQGNFEQAAPILDPDTSMRYARGFNAFDLNRDGFIDLAGFDGSFLRAFLNPGNRASDWASTGPEQSLGSYPCCEPLAIQSDISPSAGDFNKDGVIDLVALLVSPNSPGPVHVLHFEGWDDGQITWVEKVVDSILYPGWAGHAGVADLDKDGNLDIHVGGWDKFDGLFIYFGDGQGGFQAETLRLDHGIGEFNSFVAGDLNGDGVPELVTNRSTGSNGASSGFEVLYGDKLPINNLYLPHLVQTEAGLPGNDWTTGLQVQNTGLLPAGIRLLAYGAEGEQIDCGTRVADSGGSVNFLMPTACQLTGPFNGSGIAVADEYTQGIVHINNAPGGQAAGIYTGTPANNVSNTLFFPLIKHNHFGRTTEIVVQNASDDPVDLVATFRIAGRLFEKEYENVPARAKIVIVPADAEVPSGNGQVGSLTVTGTGPLAGASLEHQHGVAEAQNLQATRAFTPSDSYGTLFCPIFRNAHTASGLTTGVQVQNTNLDYDTMVHLTFTPRSGDETITVSKRIDPGASATFYAPDIGVPEGSVGSVDIYSYDDLVAVVNDAGREGGVQRTTTYACIPGKYTTNSVVLPLYKEFWLGNTTGIQIQNASYYDASIRITYIASNKDASVTLTPGFLIPPLGSTTFFGVSQKLFPQSMTVVAGDPAALANTYGSVIVESDVPIVAIANEGSYGPNPSLQDTKNYEGINR